MHRHDVVLAPEALDDRDRPRLDHEEVVAGVSGPEQDLPRRDGTDRAHLAEPRPLLVVQPRERAVAVGRLLDAEPERLGHRITNATSSTKQ